MNKKKDYDKPIKEVSKALGLPYCWEETMAYWILCKLKHRIKRAKIYIVGFFVFAYRSFFVKDVYFRIQCSQTNVVFNFCFLDCVFSEEKREYIQFKELLLVVHLPNQEESVFRVCEDANGRIDDVTHLVCYNLEKSFEKKIISPVMLAAFLLKEHEKAMKREEHFNWLRFWK